MNERKADCRQLRPMLLEFLNGGLDGDAEMHGRVRGHIIVCEDCAAAAAELFDGLEAGQAVAPPLPAAVQTLFDSGQDLNEQVRQALKKTLLEAMRGDLKDRVSRWIEVFEGKCEGAVRFLNQRAGLAVEGLGELLRADVHWRFGYAGFAAQSLQPLARLGGAPGSRRLVKGVRAEGGAVVRGAVAEVALENDRATVSIRGLKTSAPPLLLLCSTGGRVKVQECVRVDTQQGVCFRAEVQDLRPNDLLLIEPSVESDPEAR